MNVNDFLIKYLSDHLNLRDEDIEKIQVHKELRNYLHKTLSFKCEDKDETYSFLTGSYVRNTSIRPPKDVDFFIVLNESKYENISPNELLKLIEDLVSKEFSDKSVYQQTHSVTIEYDEEFGIDIIPAFEADDNLYRIPEAKDGQNKWLTSNPKIHREILTEANNGCDGQLVPIVKLLKSWKRDKCDFVKSFHLELLTVEILKDKKFNGYPEGLYCFFKEASNYVSEPKIKDPANNNVFVDDYLQEDERGKLSKIIESEKFIVERALKLEQDGKSDEAIKQWDKIFTSNIDRKKYINVNPAHEQNLPYKENLKYKVGISAKILHKIKNVYKEKYYSNGRKLPKDWKIRFYADPCGIPEPYDVYWQVVNTGKEAEAANDLRGSVLRDEGSRLRNEHTKYAGSHHVNCFIVKDSQCIAKDRFFVNIK